MRKDQEFPLATAEGNRTYKLIDVRPDKAVIVNAQNPGAPIEIGFAAPVREDLTTDYTDITNGAQSALECGAACAALDPLSQRMERSTEQIRIGQNARD